MPQPEVYRVAHDTVFTINVKVATVRNTHGEPLAYQHWMSVPVANLDTDINTVIPQPIARMSDWRQVGVEMVGLQKVCYFRRTVYLA